MSDAGPPKGDAAVFGYLEMIALAFAFEGTTSLLTTGPTLKCVSAYLVSGALFFAGVKWPWVKLQLGERFATTATQIATDFRWWLLLLAVVFVYLGWPLYSPYQVAATSPTTPAPQPIGPSSPSFPQPEVVRPPSSTGERTRRLLPGEKDMLADLLRAIGDGKLYVAHMAADEEAALFALDLEEAVRAGGWQVETPPIPADQDVVGLWILAGDNDARAKALHGLFNGMGFACGRVSGSGGEPGTTDIFVGRRAKPGEDIHVRRLGATGRPPKQRHLNEYQRERIAYILHGNTNFPACTVRLLTMAGSG